MAKPPTPESRGLLQVVVYDGLIPVNTGVILGPASKSEEVPSFFSSTSSLNGPACPPHGPIETLQPVAQIVVPPTANPVLRRLIDLRFTSIYPRISRPIP
ncbi:uncharacterized protein N7469_002614 [Penicillium citrinum]|uniref:Uncharacterized protein n=1 Tax=Penicillium citrinum TaxID=5077 RepID=A0A9W9PAP1_PENCI|nr:uncharacterized protein N7469_002614 [Penicillium citrinum]KAJ5241023.1 hypothetical protein N7469_002614 [Penicillium citrinum]